MDSRELDDFVDDLYSGPPAEFVGRRSEAVKAARASKDRELAEAVGELRKPTVSAWLVNLLVRDDPALADQLVALGEGLRAAERSLDGPALRELSSQRRQLVRSLVARARALARPSGTAVGEAAVHELESTLTAALADAAIAREVVSGRLTGPREHVGFGGAEVASDSPAPAPARTRVASAPAKAPRSRGGLRLVTDSERSTPAAADPAATQAATKAATKAARAATKAAAERERDARREAQRRRAQEEARAAWEQAERDASRARERHEAAVRVRDESAGQVDRALEAASRAHADEDDLVSELAEVRRRLAAAGKVATAADKALATAQQTLRADEKDVAAAERELLRLEKAEQAAAAARDDVTPG
ncbi:hypothetical protein [Cellulomonas edaphi]|uniref:Transposase n=1 Tax=Cellulomonas edaphi TaxID=3053468 RepID=A0ABT7S7L9_9CELL|nr:hypothetical protein [Cellulomons edaphi]MDM7831610.1 hypothetical protein [Cellulomons edaphi]